MEARDRGVPPREVGRYVLYDEIASGGMASIHLGRLLGVVGFSRTVAIKRLHAHYAREPEFVAMFLDEARLAARIRHPNVVSTIDVAAEGGEVFLVMEYVLGESLSRLLRASREARTPPPVAIGVAIVADLLQGLHAAHEARGEDGESLGIVHRDVSPHNVIVGRDGVARVVDFGVAKAASRLQSTHSGQIKGKLAYMAPEQIERKQLDRRADVFAASIVLWETLTAQRLFAADEQATIVASVLSANVLPPSVVVPSLPAGVDDVVMRGLSRDRDARYATAAEMALALERVVAPARPVEVGAWVERVGGPALESRASRLAEIESRSSADAGAHARPVAPRVELAPDVSPSPIGIASRPQEGEGAASKITDLSSSTAPEARASRRRARVWMMGSAGAGVVALGIGGAAFFRWHGGGEVAHAVAPQQASAPAAPSTSATTAAAAAIASVPMAPPDAATSVASGAQTAGGSRAPSRPSRGRPPTPPAGRPGPDCDPPYVFGPDGVKRFKAGCI